MKWIKLYGCDVTGKTILFIFIVLGVVVVQPNSCMSRPQINTTEETFQSDIIDSTIFQTNSFDVLSEFALLVSSTTCSAYSSVLSNESEKMFQQNFQNNLFHLNKFDNDSEFFGQRNCCSADCVAGPAWRDRVHKYCVTILYIGSHQSRP